MTTPTLMRAARLHGPLDVRIDSILRPEDPRQGEAIVRVTSVGVCGSDMHMYRHAMIGDCRLEGPLVLGHEFGGVVETVGPGESLDGTFRPLEPGTRVAVDPAFPCGKCEWCERGDPNLCCDLPFCGLWPTDGCLAERVRVPSRNCYVVPDSIPDDQISLLEPLGVAIHTVDLAHTRVGQSVALLGVGPVGLCILQVLKAAGLGPIFVTDRFPWRLDLALRLGADRAWCCEEVDVVKQVAQATAGRGVDIAIEAAHGGEAQEQAAEVAALGGKLLIVGIDANDRLSLRHSAARRKGLTIVMVRRMKHTYPRAIAMADRGLVDLGALITHRFPLEETAAALDLNAHYRGGVVKAIVEV